MCYRWRMRDPISVYKKIAKKMLKAYRAGDPDAVRRVEAVYDDQGRGVSLMKMQHVLAREAGYKNWTEMVNAVREDLNER